MCYDVAHLTDWPYLKRIYIITLTRTMEFLDEIINMRIKPSQKVILKKKAEKENLSVSTYCRVKLVKDLEE